MAGRRKPIILRCLICSKPFILDGRKKYTCSTKCSRTYADITNMLNSRRRKDNK